MSQLYIQLSRHVRVTIAKHPGTLPSVGEGRLDTECL